MYLLLDIKYCIIKNVNKTLIKVLHNRQKGKYMETLLGLVLLFLFFGVPSIITNYKFDHSLPPGGYQTDWAAMNRDLAMGKSKNEVMQKSNRGEYYVKKK